MGENELESFILSKNGTMDARFVLGKKMCEGTDPRVQHNESKGVNWLKEAIKADHFGAIEYKTYHDIRFDRKPDLDKITSSLETII
jgi:hypothetical protein